MISCHTDLTGLSVLSFTVVMTADKVLKVRNSDLVIYGQPRRFHSVRAHSLYIRVALSVVSVSGDISDL